MQIILSRDHGYCTNYAIELYFALTARLLKHFGPLQPRTRLFTCPMARLHVTAAQSGTSRAAALPPLA